MKKLVFLLAFVSTMFMVSCEKDIVNPTDPNNPINGNVVDLLVEVTHVNVTTFGGNDGKITVTVKTGNPPYDFIIDGVTKNSSSNDSFTFNDLVAGSYDVSVKDNKDKAFDKTVVVGEADETFADLVVDYTVADNDFNNNSGVIEVSVTGGKEPYTFKLNDGSFVNNNVFSNLGGGTYSVTVKDDRGVEVTKDNINVMYGFDISVNVVHSNTHTDNGGKITINPNVTGAGNSPYKFSIDGVNWVDNKVFDNMTPTTYTVYAKDKFETVRESTVVVENHYNGYRVGDLYNKDGYNGVVFKVLGDNTNDDILIADTQNGGVNTIFSNYNVTFLGIINTGGLNWKTMNIDTLEMYLNVAKDFIDSGNVFNVQVFVDTWGQRYRYWSNSVYINNNNKREVAYIQNGIVKKEGILINISQDMRGRYVATRKNNK